MIDAAALARLTPGALVVNMARGGIVSDDALVEAVQSVACWGRGPQCLLRRAAGGGSSAPSSTERTLTPHVGASTVEAQRSVAVDVCRAVRNALLRGELSRSINAAGVAGEHWPEVRPAANLAGQLAAVGRALLASQGARAVDRIDMSAGTALAGARDALLAAAAMGALSAVVADERLNLINARALAAARGIALAFTEAAGEVIDADAGPVSHGVSVRVTAGTREVFVGGVAHPAAFRVSPGSTNST